MRLHTLHLTWNIPVLTLYFIRMLSKDFILNVSNLFSVFSGEGAAGPYPAPAAAGAQGPGVPRLEGDPGGDEGAQEPQVSCYWSPGHNTDT